MNRVSNLTEVKVKDIDYKMVDDTTDAFDKLKRYIEKHGLQNPVVVSETTTGKYRAEIGHHRLHACVLLGYKTIQVEIIEGRI